LNLSYSDRKIPMLQVMKNWKQVKNTFGSADPNDGATVPVGDVLQEANVTPEDIRQKITQKIQEDAFLHDRVEIRGSRLRLTAGLMQVRCCRNFSTHDLTHPCIFPLSPLFVSCFLALSRVDELINTQSLFDESLSKITRYVEEFLTTSSAMPNMIFVVGGCSQNKYVEGKLRDVIDRFFLNKPGLEGLKPDVTFPVEKFLAVLKGDPCSFREDDAARP